LGIVIRMGKKAKGFALICIWIACVVLLYYQIQSRNPDHPIASAILALLRATILP
jgi:hypothetical protein